MSTRRVGKRRRERQRRQRRAEHRAQVTARSEAKGDAPLGTLKPAATADAPKLGCEPVSIDAALTWHIAKIAPGSGTKAVDGLKKAKVSVFRPRASEVVVRRGRRVIRRTPLLVRTAFIGVASHQSLDDVAALPGIAGIVAHPEEDAAASGNIPGFVMRPARLDPEALQGFADRLAAGEIVQPVGIKQGDNVVVRVGAFASFPGVVEEILPNDMAKVGLAIFGRSVPKELGLAEIQVVA